jgi:SAM-dependent methyltransferase
MRETPPAPILDVRREDDFAASHAPGAVNIPAEELAGRTHELPPKGSAVRVFDSDPDRLAVAAYLLRQRGYEAVESELGPGDLTQAGPSAGRLWRPSEFLVEALDRLCSLAPAAAPGRALDLACGAGREAVHLAQCGWQVDAIDLLPDALEKAAGLARRCGVTLRTIRQDLKREPFLPRGAYSLVCVFRFLHRPLLPAIRDSVAAGGFVIYEAFHSRDSRAGRGPLPPGRTLRDGELAAAFEGFAPIIARDGVPREGRRFCQLLARKPTGNAPASPPASGRLPGEAP